MAKKKVVKKKKAEAIIERDKDLTVNLIKGTCCWCKAGSLKIGVTCTRCLLGNNQFKLRKKMIKMKEIESNIEV